MELTACKPGQPVEMKELTGRYATQNGRQGFLINPEPDEYGLHTVRFEVKPATRTKDAVTQELRVTASKISVLADKKSPRQFHWHFRAKGRRYAIQPSGEQPQQIS